MAHLWLNDASQSWAILPLDQDAYTLDAQPPAAFAVPGSADTHPAGGAARRHAPHAVLIRARTPDAVGWALLVRTPRDVRVNGLSVHSGLKVLTDRDEIRASGQPPMYFSTELLAEIAPFPGAAQPLFCPRCKQAVAPGTPAVRCPQCDVWHHQSDDLPCWTYAGTCATCSHATALDAGFVWTPEGL